jgi:hypothetical protein
MNALGGGQTVPAITGDNPVKFLSDVESNLKGMSADEKQIAEARLQEMLGNPAYSNMRDRIEMLIKRLR